MALLQFKQKQKSNEEETINEELISIDKLPEEYLKLEYPNEWKYLQKVRRNSYYYEII
ncbi:hypothetical protein [Saccharolobus sp. A20]|uniref:hypothetical protein n=1 Tax=Saccharolobus sp. A20 TaxID=1891280 RepID=UPI0018D44B76|nr:hypothetical protein [Sulfolobus sp. A20]